MFGIWIKQCRSSLCSTRWPSLIPRRQAFLYGKNVIIFTQQSESAVLSIFIAGIWMLREIIVDYRNVVRSDYLKMAFLLIEQRLDKILTYIQPQLTHHTRSRSNTLGSSHCLIVSYLLFSFDWIFSYLPTGISVKSYSVRCQEFLPLRPTYCLGCLQGR